MFWIILIIGILIALFLSGCKNTPNPEPEPTPEPEPEPEPEPKWSDYYPVNWHKPIIDLDKHRWIPSDYNSIEWQNYVALLSHWNETLYNNAISKGEISDRKLWLILSQKKANGEPLFKWTSEREDRWEQPETMLILRNENREPDPNGFYREDCDGFSRFHNQYLFEWCNYWASIFLEVYWKKRYWSDVSNSYQWKNLGHAITVYKITPEADWKCFSNQTWLSASHGEKRIEDFVLKFVPINKPEFVDMYELTTVRGRHPINGELLFEVKGDKFDI